MSVSRGKFLKSLGKSIPGLVLGGGVATAAQTLLGRMAAGAAREASGPAAKEPMTKIAKVDFITRGPSAGHQVALTFDDGPTPGVTDLILDALKQRQLRATFFMVGNRLASAPDLARRVRAEGHEVGNHTFTHAKLNALPDGEAVREIQKTQDLMGELLNHRPAWFRPPYGALRRNQVPMIQAAGLEVVLWEVDSGDWSQPGDDPIAETVLKGTRPGSIILCHDLHRQTADAVPRVLDGLLDRGFTFSTVSGLMRKPGRD